MLLSWKHVGITLFVVLSAVKALNAEQQLPRYTLAVRLFPEQHKIEGTAHIVIPEGREIQLSFSNLKIKRAQVDGKPLKMQTDTLAVRADGLIKKTIEIEYGAEFTGTVRETITETSFATAQNIIAENGIILLHGWYPEVRGRCLFNFTVKIPEYFDAISEAESSVVRINDGQKIIAFHFPYPLPALSLVAGRYITRSYNHRGITIKTYFFADDRELSEMYFAHSKRFLEIYETLLGTYPYRSFAIVENNYQTGYSFPTYTLLGSRVIRLPFIVETSLGHEILHQWLGNSVYVDDTHGNWAEGIATYLSDHWYSHQTGQGPSYRKKLLTDYMNYVHPDNEITLSSFKRPDSYATRAVGYNKAAMVFHMLRLQIGDEHFFKSLKQFINNYRFTEAGWHDIRDLFMAESGQNLTGFFQQWLNRKGAPEFTITHFQSVFRDNSFQLSFDIVQDNEPFSLTLPLHVITDRGEESFFIEIKKAQTHVEKPFIGRPLKIIVDENYDTMRRLADNEVAPVLSAFFGDKQAAVIVPAQNTGPYRDAVAFFTSLGYRVQKDTTVLIDELKNRSVLICSDQNRVYRQMFAGESLPQGGCVVKVHTNPLNPRHVVVVMTGRGAEEIKPVVPKLARYGNASLLIFENGAIRAEQREASVQGLVHDLGIPVAGIMPRDAIPIDTVVQSIRDKRVIYIGESHTEYAHHVLQLEIIRRLFAVHKQLIIGMEMFQQPFQKYLDDYIAQRISEEELLKKTEYFFRWGYDYALYRDILHFARAHAIPVIALNLRKEITEKVAETGLHGLSKREREELPATMNLTDQNYRAYLKQVFLQHEKNQKQSFEHFYLSQILWDETMAHAVADALATYPKSQMVVLSGSGHLQHAWGIPSRVYRMTHATSALLLNDSGQGIERGLADFILYTEPMSAPETPRLQVLLKKEKEGVSIEKVNKNGPGEMAGLKEKDIIKAMDDKIISDIDDIKIFLLMKNKGDTVKVTVHRKMQDGKMAAVILTVML